MDESSWPKVAAEVTTASATTPRRDSKLKTWASRAYTALAIGLLFANYFLSQYDKFILSYFQDSVTADLSLSATQYATLSGYATGIAYALLALPTAYVADYLPAARVWALAIASAWWSVCVIFQSLAQRFWQLLLARIAMGIGQAAVEALSVSLISDLVGGWRNVFVGSSVFYVGVYVGEAVSGQIAAAQGPSWRVALRDIGIAGVVVAVLLRLCVREPGRRAGLLEAWGVGERVPQRARLRAARAQFVETLRYVAHLHSFWLLVLSASARQLAGNVFGYYMPSYLANTYPEDGELLSRYGIIVGVVGTVSVLGGGVLTGALWRRTKMTPLYLTGIGGMVSSAFVLIMIFSRNVAPEHSASVGVRILYGSMSAAYLTAETWLGALAGLVALLLPPRYKTFGLAIWGSIQVLVYSSGPEIIGLALRNDDPASESYTKETQVALAVIIPVCYWIAGVGFLCSIPLLRKDLSGQLVTSPMSAGRRFGLWSAAAVLVAMVAALFVADVTFDSRG